MNGLAKHTEKVFERISKLESIKPYLFPSFAAVCTINSIKVVKYRQISAK